MKIADWAENLRVAIVGAVEILDDAGNHRHIALSRIKISGQW
jgi:hypothetical protein